MSCKSIALSMELAVCVQKAEGPDVVCLITSEEILLRSSEKTLRLHFSILGWQHRGMHRKETQCMATDFPLSCSAPAPPRTNKVKIRTTKSFLPSCSFTRLSIRIQRGMPVMESTTSRESLTSTEVVSIVRKS